ncbi:hypothetical protein OKW32_005288 [Paraburkholderia youngii]
MAISPWSASVAVVAMQFALLDRTGAHTLKRCLNACLQGAWISPCASPDALMRGYGDALA